MPLSTYGDGIKKVLALSNAIAMAAGGILLIDEIETAIHKKYYDDIFQFVVKACERFNVQVFISTHNIEAIDGILSTQGYDNQETTDNIQVVTLKRGEDRTYSRALTGRELNAVVAHKGVQLVTISRPTAFGEYAPYQFASSEDEFRKEVMGMGTV